jgi:hypothetical protein
VAKYYFNITKEEISSSLKIENGERTLVGRKNCKRGMTAYQTYLMPKLSAIVENRETNFQFPRGIMKSGHGLKMYPFCSHDDEEKRSVMSFDLSEFNGTKDVECKWEVGCKSCNGVNEKHFDMITSVNQLRKSLEENIGKEEYKSHADSFEIVMKMMNDIKLWKEKNDENAVGDEQGVPEPPPVEEIAQAGGPPVQVEPIVDEVPEHIANPPESPVEPSELVSAAGSQPQVI